jgi:flagellar basal body-associated protein FliL
MGCVEVIILVVFVVAVFVFMAGLVVYCFRETGVSGAMRKLVEKAEAKEEEKRQEKVYSDLVEMIMKKSEKVN